MNAVKIQEISKNSTKKLRHMGAIIHVHGTGNCSQRFSCQSGKSLLHDALKGFFNYSYCEITNLSNQKLAQALGSKYWYSGNCHACVI